MAYVDVPAPFSLTNSQPTEETLFTRVKDDLLAGYDIGDTNPPIDNAQEFINTVSKGLAHAMTYYYKDLVFTVEDASHDPTSILSPVATTLEDKPIQIQSDTSIKAYMRAVVMQQLPNSQFTKFIKLSKEERLSNEGKKLMQSAVMEIRAINAWVATISPNRPGIKLLQNVLANLLFSQIFKIF